LIKVRHILHTFALPTMAFTLLLVSMLSIAPVQAASESEPDVAIKGTTDELLAQFETRRFDFARMSRLVLGKYWKKATDEQKGDFVDAFKALLVKTYASALFEYTGQEIVYKPMKAVEGDKAEVKSEIDLGGGTTVPINYSMVWSPIIEVPTVARFVKTVWKN